MIAKLGTPEIMGQYTLSLAICTPIVLLTNMQLRAVQATDANNSYRFGLFFGLRLLSSVLALFFIISAFALVNYKIETKWVILAVGLVRISESLSDIFYGYFQKSERLDKITISMANRGILTLVLFGSIFVATDSLYYAVLGILLINILNLVFIDFYNCSTLFLKNEQEERKGRVSIILELKKEFAPIFHFEKLKKLSMVSFPLGLASVVVALTNNTPRYIIENHLGDYDLGIFGALSYPMLAGVAVVHALAQSASPRLARFFCEGDMKKFKELVYKLFLIGLAVGGIGIFCAFFQGERILELLYSKEYAQYNDLFKSLMVVAGLSYVSMFLCYGLVAAKLYKQNLAVHLSAFVVTTISSVILIPKFQLTGAVISIGVGYFAINVASACILSFICKKRCLTLDAELTAT